MSDPVNVRAVALGQRAVLGGRVDVEIVSNPEDGVAVWAVSVVGGGSRDGWAEGYDPRAGCG
jgi:hypothetical protein